MSREVPDGPSDLVHKSLVIEGTRRDILPKRVGGWGVLHEALRAGIKLLVPGLGDPQLVIPITTDARLFLLHCDGRHRTIDQRQENLPLRLVEILGGLGRG